MVKALGALGAVEVAGRLLVGGVKSLLAGIDGRRPAAWPLPLTALGYGAIGLAPGSTASWTSYVLGRAAKIYLQQGCQWGPRGSRRSSSRSSPQAKADSVVDRLRDDLRRRWGRDRARPLEVAVYGIINAGKSSLINALPAEPTAPTGPIGGTTAEVAEVDWRVDRRDDPTAEVRPRFDRPPDRHAGPRRGRRRGPGPARDRGGDAGRPRPLRRSPRT